MKPIRPYRHIIAALATVLLYTSPYQQASAKEGAQDGQHYDAGIQIPAEIIDEFAITTQLVAPGKIDKRQKLTGEIALIPRNVVHVSSPVEGIVTSVNKTLGDPVEKSDVLARLNSRELATARAELLAANSKATLARRTFEREKSLFEKKISAESDYLASEQAFAAAKIDVESARHRLLALGVGAKQVSGDHSEDSLTSYALVAAASGVVTEKHITKGELVGPSRRSFVIADLSTVWLELIVYQKDLDVIRQGLEVSVSSGSGTELTRGEIEFVNPIIDRETRSTTARAVIDNASGEWRPGMFVEAEVTIGSMEATIVVPQTAVQTIDGKPIVFIKHGKEFELREVQLGAKDSVNVAVTQGLSPGETIATTNSFTLKAELQKGEFGDGHGH